jgi:hypothetical protein
MKYGKLSRADGLKPGCVAFSIFVLCASASRRPIAGTS